MKTGRIRYTAADVHIALLHRDQRFMMFSCRINEGEIAYEKISANKD